MVWEELLRDGRAADDGGWGGRAETRPAHQRVRPAAGGHAPWPPCVWLRRPLTFDLCLLQYGEEEVCSDRLDTDFPDIDLSQLDTSDFDSVNCLSELQWCSDQQADASPASIHYSAAGELFEVRPRPLSQPSNRSTADQQGFKCGSLPVTQD